MVAIVGVLTFLSFLFLKKSRREVDIQARYTHLALFRRYGHKHYKEPMFLNPLTKNVNDVDTYYFHTKDLGPENHIWDSNLKRGWLKK
jgi:hypothetical protein